MRRSTINAVLTMGLSLSVGAARADSIDIGGQQPWETCGFCHSIDGISRSPRFPHLAGQQRDYLIAQLHAFRNGTRANDDDVMHAIARGLSESEIAVVADYFSALSLPVAPTAKDAAAIAVFANGDAQRAIPACSACHGNKAEGRGIVPRLAGQQLAYLGKQLDDFAEGRRQGNFDHAFVRFLSASQRRVLAAYVSGLSAKTAAAARIAGSAEPKN